MLNALASRELGLFFWGVSRQRRCLRVAALSSSSSAAADADGEEIRRQLEVALEQERHPITRWLKSIDESNSKRYLRYQTSFLSEFGSLQDVADEPDWASALVALGVTARGDTRRLTAARPVRRGSSASLFSHNCTRLLCLPTARRQLFQSGR